MLKVTLLADEWGSSKGGLSTINRELAKHLAKLPDVEVTFFLPKCSEEDKNAAKDLGIAITEAEERPGYEPVDWLAFPPRSLSIDIVVGHGVKLGRQAQNIRETRNCKWVQVVHTAPEELSMYKTTSEAVHKGEEKHKAETKLCEIADFVVAVGPKLADIFSACLRSRKKEVFNFTPGVFNEFCHVEQASEDGIKFRVLVFGRGDPEDFQLKGYDIAAQAVSILNDSSYHLIFVGAPNGKEEAVKNNLLKHNISPSQLTVRGFRESREKLSDLLCEADLAIMPSRTEGFGLAGVEAFSAGLPILVSGNSGFGEALRKVPFGLNCIVDSEDVTVWGNRIKQFREKDRQMRLEESEVLRTSYAKRYDWQKQCEELVKKLLSMDHDVSQDTHNAQDSNGKRKRSLTTTGNQAPKRLKQVDETHQGFQNEEHLSSQGPATASHPHHGAPSTDQRNPGRTLQPPGSEFENLVTSMKEKYTRRARLQPVPWCDTSLLSFDRVYTRLTMKARKMQSPELTSQEVEVYDIFCSHKNCTNPRSVLIEGNPGIGKTTFCQKLAKDWASGVIPANCSFPKVELVLLLKCRDIDGDVRKEIEDQLLPLDVTDQEKCHFWEFLQNIQEKLLIILDGLDELREHARHDVDNLLLRKILPKCFLVVSARQEKGIHVRKHFDTLLEITGFTKDDAVLYIQRHFRDKEKESLATALIEAIKVNDHLRELLQNPLNTVLLCLVFEDCEGTLPSTRTELYWSIIVCILKRFCTKQARPRDDSTLIQQFEVVLVALGELALDGLKKGTLYFSEKALNSSTQQVPQIGFVSKQASTKVIRPEHYYSFPHKTYQEFFAALYLAHMVRTNVRDVYRFVSSVDDITGKFKQVLLFVAGILREDGRRHFEMLGELLTRNRNSNDHPFKFLIRSFKESGHIDKMAAALAPVMPLYRSLDMINDSVMLNFYSWEYIDEHGDYNKYDDYIHFLVVGYSILPSGLPEFLSESTSSMSLYSTQRIDHQTGAVLASLSEDLSENKSLTSVTLNFFQCDVGDACLAFLGKFLLENTSLTSLTLQFSECHLGDWLAILRKVLSEGTSLTSLTLQFSKCNLGDCLAILGKGLSENTSLTSLTFNFSECRLSDACLAFLGKRLSENKSLSSLTFDFSGCNLSDACLAILGDLSETTSLTSLTLQFSKCDLGDCRAILGKGLSGNKSLTSLTLNLTWCNLSGACLANLGKGLLENTSLTSLTLQFPDFSPGYHDASLAFLGKGLSENKSLTSLTLNLTWCNLSDACLANLGKGLLENTSLTSLTLQFPDFSPGYHDASLAFLGKGLSENKSLTSLTLKFFKFDLRDSCLPFLSKGLSENTSLTSLTLQFYKCDLSDSCLAILGKGLSENKPLSSLALYFSSCTLFDRVLPLHGKGLLETKSLSSLAFDFCRCHFSDACVAFFGKGLSENKSLSSLAFNFSECDLSDACLAILGKGLSENKSLLSLSFDFSECHLSDGCLAFLGKGLSANKSLSSLAFNFSECDLSNACLAILGKGLSENKSLSSLAFKFFCCNLSDGCLDFLGEGLSENKSLTSLYLSTFQCDLSDACLVFLGRGLSENKSLTSVTFDFFECDPGDSCLTILGKGLLENKSLSSLAFDFSTCNLSDGCLAFLGKGLSENKSLSSLAFDFSTCNLSDGCLAILGKGLSENKSLSSLAFDFSRCNLSDACLPFLGKGLSENKSLSSLAFDFSTCNLSDGCLAFLGKDLSENKSLSSLAFDFSRCNLSDACLAFLGKGMSENKSLTSVTLNFFQCDPSDACLAILGKGLSENTSLTSLTLQFRDFSPGYHDASLAILGKGLSENTSLTSLTLQFYKCDLSDCLAILGKGLSENKSLSSLAFDFSRCNLSDACLAFLGKGLSENTSLTSLTLVFSSCHFDSDACLAFVVNGLSENKSLASLTLKFDQCDLSDTSLASLGEAMSENKSLASRSLSNNKIHCIF